MVAPNLDKLDCCDEEIQYVINVSKEDFEKKAREWTQKYAVPIREDLFKLNVIE